MTYHYEAIASRHAAGESIQGIAKATGLSRSTVRSYLKRAARHGIACGLLRAPNVPGFSISTTTRHLVKDAQGRVTVAAEWRRDRPDAMDTEAWISALEDRIKGKAPTLPRPRAGSDADLLLEIPIPDHHMGMLAWSQETGADYDCKIATRLLVGAVASLIAESPRVGRIALVVLGDYYHSDNRSGMTEKSGNVLDVDSRFSRRVDAGIEALCACVELAATHAASVDVVVISGNHDWHSAKWLARVMAAYYSKHKRVKIHTDPAPRKYLTHGKVMLAYMHGDTMKAAHFARVIPAESGDAWAQTQYRYGRVGHWHHRSTEEFPGVVVETLPTLAAPDAYATEHGYLSRRAITGYLWSAKWGLRAKMERSPGEILGA
jgi:hypothetical protein